MLLRLSTSCTLGMNMTYITEGNYSAPGLKPTHLAMKIRDCNTKQSALNYWQSEKTTSPIPCPVNLQQGTIIKIKNKKYIRAVPVYSAEPEPLLYLRNMKHSLSLPKEDWTLDKGWSLTGWKTDAARLQTMQDTHLRELYVVLQMKPNT